MLFFLNSTPLFEKKNSIHFYGYSILHSYLPNSFVSFLNNYFSTFLNNKNNKLFHSFCFVICIIDCHQTPSVFSAYSETK